MKQDLMKFYKQIKWIQLTILIIITVASFILLYSNETIRKSIYSNRTLFTVVTIFWILLLLSFIFILYDFTKMKFFIKEGHALNKAAYLDKVTDLPNRNSLDTVFINNMKEHDLSTMGCALITISNLQKINEECGREKGDIALQNFSDLLEKVGDTYGFVGRNGGNEFITVLDNCDTSKAEKFISALEDAITQYNNKPDTQVKIEINYAYALNAEIGAESFSDLITYTYKKARRG